ncbi:unnamed protein product [Owenia fusiformis]|uniref:Malic enzyme n=1 Tax=Owenia fusiformis TaxID=6347 RepID=A0A8J1XRS6_OWEFU|nr:unnamed protein product [Owenia fusiformis]
MAAKESHCGGDVPKKEQIALTRVRGIDVLRDPYINKDMAFTLRERQLLGVHGLLPPRIETQDLQCYNIMQNFYRFEHDLDRYIFLMGLQDRNEKLFYRVLEENVGIMMPIVYTPTVGLACQKYGLIFRKPRGLFISIHDKGYIYDILCNWPEHDIKAIVVTDGERILGLGDLGCYGMGIPVGKLALYTALAGVKPHQCLPILLDVGTNNETLLKDPMYLGLKQKRVTGQAYDDFIEEFMQAIIKRYGQNTLVQFEDFGNHNAFRFLEKYRNHYCTFNDDIQGTAAVAVAGILSALRITGKTLQENKFVFQGAGEASIGIAKLLILAMKEDGCTEEEAVTKIYMVDSRGLITKDRPSGGVTGEKLLFAKDHEHLDNLETIINNVKPTAIIGAAAIAGAFTPSILKAMASFNDRPIIFALSNPTSKAECTAEQAYSNTQGRCVFASGSPFDPVTLGEKTFHPGQGNNAYIFPGIALGVICCGVRHISEEIFLKSAKALASMVLQSDLDKGRVYPSLSKIREVSTNIAIEIAHYAYKYRMAAHYPEPQNKDEFIHGQQYCTQYESFVPQVYDWPNDVANPLTE